MSAIADLVALLLSTGIPPEKLAAAVDLAHRHAVESAEFHRNSTGFPVDLAAEKRRAYDRERKRNSAEKQKPASSLSLNASSTETTKKEEGASGRAKRARGHPLPDDFKPNVGHYAVAEELRGRREFADECCTEMREWAKANGNRAITRKADWDMTLLSWIRRTARAGPRGSPNGSAPRPGSKEDRQERTYHAMQKLNDFIARSDDEGPSGETREANAGLLPFVKPVRP